METYLGKMVICPNGHLGYVEMETLDQVAVKFDNKLDLMYFNKGEVALSNEFNSKMQEFFDDLWWTMRVYLDYIVDFLRNLRWYFKNLHHFRKDLWNYRNWDSEYCTNVFATALEGLRDCLKDGHEVEITRTKKVKRIQELIDLLRNDPEDDNVLYDKYIKHELDYEKKLTEEEHETLSKELAEYEEAIQKAEDKRLKRIFQIIKGQSEKELDTTKDIEKLERKDPERAKKESLNGYYSLFEEKFDGTGYKTWWD